MNTLTGPQVLLYGAAASLLAGLATGAGALPGLWFRDLSRRTLDVLLGFAAGVMLAATFGVMIGFVVMMAMDTLLG